MACPNATSPVNLSKNTAGTCNLKCDFSQQYTVSNVNAENKGDYIRYTLSSLTPQATFNKEQYNVSELRLYQPSLHRYGGIQCDGELLISHTNVKQNTTLCICIPIVSGGNTISIIDTLVGQVIDRANSNGGQTAISIPNFNLANVVPNKPYYNYTGTMPTLPCIGNIQYIVFDKSNAISVTSKTIAGLKKIITAHTYGVHKNPNGIFYNENGPSKGTSLDDIYIECNPTGSDGKTYASTNDTQTSTSSSTSSASLTQWVIPLVGVILFIILIYVAPSIVDSIAKSMIKKTPSK
jgi:carbonic anhydrase